ncbi:hypothetical protein [Sporosarcina sp. FSL K6-5500]|uniref:hypothetical protein n=1 Tax=Sporosarcina sp. FSL K6-5500 TaxID=2921558 RepID=UPI0030F5E7B6
MERNLRRTGNQIGRFKQSAVSNFAGVAKGVAGMAAAYMGVNAIKDLGVGMIQSAASAEAMNAQFSTVFGDMEGAATKSLEGIASETNALSGRLKGSFLGIAAFAKTSGMDTASALAMTERATLAAADGAAFYDKSVDSVAESLQSFLKGNFANDAALGISATETTRNAAANKLYGKSFKDLAEDQKQMTLLQMVEDGNKLSGAMGQAAREGDGFENVMGNMRESWDLLKQKFGAPILEPVIKGIKYLTTEMLNVDTDKIIGGFSKFGGVVKGAFDSVKPGLNWMKDTALPAVKDKVVEMYTAAQPGLNWLKDVAFPAVGDAIVVVVEKATDLYNYIKDNWALIGPVVAGVAATVAAFKIGVVAMTTATAIWKGVTTGVQIATMLLNGTLMLSPLTWVALAIGAVVAVGILLWKNWDTLKALGQSLWDKLKEVWMGIEIGFSNAWNVVKTAAGDSLNFIIDKINTMIGVINKIPGVKIPIVAKVEWGQAAQPANAGKAIKGNMESFAVGTNRVKRDMVANIHKDEMIIPAVQSRNLRKQGVTIDNIDGAMPRAIEPVVSKSAGSTFVTRNEDNRSSINNQTRNEDKHTVTNIATTNVQNSDLPNLIQQIMQLIQLLKNTPKGDVKVTIDGHNKSTSEIVNELIPMLKLRLANL